MGSVSVRPSSSFATQKKKKAKMSKVYVGSVCQLLFPFPDPLNDLAVAMTAAADPCSAPIPPDGLIVLRLVS